MLLWCLVTTTLSESQWSPGGHQPDTCHPSTSNWLHECVQVQQDPCPLPPGQFPWAREDYANLLSDVDLVPGLSQPETLRVLLQKFKALKLWASISKHISKRTFVFELLMSDLRTCDEHRHVTECRNTTFKSFPNIRHSPYQPPTCDGVPEHNI